MALYTKIYFNFKLQDNFPESLFHFPQFYLEYGMNRLMKLEECSRTQAKYGNQDKKIIDSKYKRR